MSRDPETGWTGLVDDEFDSPLCCGQPMYECHADHTDGKRYWHCHSCTTNREIGGAS